MCLKAFTLTESLLCLLLVALILTSLPVHAFEIASEKTNRLLCISQYVRFHNEALEKQKNLIFYPEYMQAMYEIRFNNRGNINMAQTVFLGDKIFVIGLGLGRLYEKRISSDGSFDGSYDPFATDGTASGLYGK